MGISKQRQYAREARRILVSNQTTEERSKALKQAGWRWLGCGDWSDAYRKGKVVAKFQNVCYDSDFYWEATREAMRRIKLFMPRRLIKEYYVGSSWTVQRYEPVLLDIWHNWLDDFADKCKRIGANDIKPANMTRKFRIFDAMNYEMILNEWLEVSLGKEPSTR